MTIIGMKGAKNYILQHSMKSKQTISKINQIIFTATDKQMLLFVKTTSITFNNVQKACNKILVSEQWYFIEEV